MPHEYPVRNFKIREIEGLIDKKKKRQNCYRIEKSSLEKSPTFTTSWLSCSPAIRHKRGRICTFPLGKDEKRVHPGYSNTTSASMIAVDREERLARRQGHEHTPGELWSAATPTSWSSKHRLPRILMDPRRDGSTPSTLPPPSKSPRRISRAASELHLALSLYPGRFVNQSSSLIARLAARHAARTSPFARVKPCYFLLPRDDLIPRGVREAMPLRTRGYKEKCK